MGAYIYTLKGPSRNIKVHINGKVESVALLSFHYKPISTWAYEPRWQRLAKARCQRMTNVWMNHGGMPKYVCHVFIHDDGKIDFQGSQVFEWPLKDDASICDYSTAFEKRIHVGNLKYKRYGIWEMTL